ncbi:glycoside hydrolase family 55 protein [Oculatella sp. LEGE 06141]|uniref:glycoside hydrolase family 55 protein n=1 Tax=Oculatella sp. LEGE 06141 TaxID=1828648 RepID=UPI0018823B2C|nr:glycoside hydrolase family 55 protein [Oculatella sp. LEGE 06141]MBE9178842.1 glycoside hydrolase family 55 protein [Oculatella sp. LEGE 06141]
MKYLKFSLILCATAIVILFAYGKLNGLNSQELAAPGAGSSELVAFSVDLPDTPNMPLPEDAGYTNVKDVGATGDGVTDDTEALQQVFGRNKEDEGGELRSIYLPNGTYLVSDTLEWGDKKKDVRGESRDGVIIKLKDNAPGFQDANNPKKVLQTEFDHGGQNFNQRLRNFTVDVGQGNPGAIGIGYHTNNSGGIYNVVIRSSDAEKRGHTGLSLDKEWPGPGLVQNVAIDGFDRGIFINHDQYSMTFEHIVLSNQRQVGFENSWNTVSIRDLKSFNRVPAIENRGEMALMTLVEAELTGGDPNSSAILNHGEGVLFARDIQTEGYGWAIDNQSGDRQKLQQAQVDEFVSHSVASLFPGPQQSLRLPIEDAPEIPYGDITAWASITDFGAIPNDDEDDSDAIQAAIDSGAKTVYLPTGNYRSEKSIKVHGAVHRLLGLNATVVFKVPEEPAFIIEDGDTDAVAVQVESNYGNECTYWIDHRSTRTLILSGGSYINTVPGGKVFIEDTTAVPFVFDRQQVWIRQINPESYDHNPQIVNKGSDVWILGLKTEKDRTIVGTYDGGRTEVLGGLLYKNRERVGPAPAFINEDSSVSLIYRNKGEPYQTQVWEAHNGETQEFLIRDVPASNGRMPLYVGYAPKEA